MKVAFKESEKVFDLTQFEINRTDEEQHKEHYSMLNVNQLSTKVDTLDVKLGQAKDKALAIVFPKKNRNIGKSIPDKRRNISSITRRIGQQPEADKLVDLTIPFYKTFSQADLKTLLPKVKVAAGRDRSNIKREIENRKKLILQRARHIYEKHFKYASAIICLVFFIYWRTDGSHHP